MPIDVSPGLAFINAVAKVLGLPDCVSSIEIRASVGGLVDVSVECLPGRDARERLAEVANELRGPAVANLVVVDATEAEAARPAFAYEVAVDGQKVRYEAPTREGLRQLMSDDEQRECESCPSR